MMNKLTFKQKRNLAILLAITLKCTTKALTIKKIKNGNLEIIRNLNKFEILKLNKFFTSAIQFGIIKYELRFFENDVKLLFMKDCLKFSENHQLSIFEEENINVDDRVEEYNEIVDDRFSKYKHIINLICDDDFENNKSYKFVFYFHTDHYYGFANTPDKSKCIKTKEFIIPENCYIFYGNYIEAYVANEKRNYNSLIPNWQFKQIS